MPLLGGKSPSPPFLVLFYALSVCFPGLCGQQRAAAVPGQRGGVPTRKSLSGGDGEGGIRSLLFPGWDPGSLRSPRPGRSPASRCIPARAPRRSRRGLRTADPAAAPRPLASPLCLPERSALPNSPPSVKEP